MVSCVVPSVRKHTNPSRPRRASHLLGPVNGGYQRDKAAESANLGKGRCHVDLLHDILKLLKKKKKKKVAAIYRTVQHKVVSVSPKSRGVALYRPSRWNWIIYSRGVVVSLALVHGDASSSLVASWGYIKHVPGIRETQLLKHAKSQEVLPYTCTLVAKGIRRHGMMYTLVRYMQGARTAVKYVRSATVALRRFGRTAAPAVAVALAASNEA